MLCPSWLSPNVSWLQRSETRSGNMKAKKSGADLATRYNASPRTAEAMRIPSRAVCGTYASESALENASVCSAVQMRSRTVKMTSCLPTLGIDSTKPRLDGWRLKSLLFSNKK